MLADIGCRWGIPDRWQGHGDALEIYAFDADERECERLARDAPDNVTYVAAALAASERTARLHLTADPACSSLFAPDPSTLSIFPELNVASPVGTTEITLISLDRWASAAGVEAIDIMKLDVQGAELEVLRGARGPLSGVRLIELEVAFNPIYRGQPLFGEVDSFLREQGLVLWRLTHLVHYASQPQQGLGVTRFDRQFFDSRPVDFEVGAGQVSWGHAYYCAPELIRCEWPSPQLAVRDAFAAESFGFQEITEPARRIAPPPASGGSLDTHSDAPR